MPPASNDDESLLTLPVGAAALFWPISVQFNSIQDYLYGAFYNTIVAKQLQRKLSFKIDLYCRNSI